MKQTFPRLMLAAPKSGSGKTVMTCGLLAALKRRGYSCMSFKCGPDYIDPMFHKTVLGMEGANLDTWFLGKESVTQLFTQKAQGMDFSLLEGVMGFYDGVGGDTAEASSYDVAAAVLAPVVLVVDGKGASLSLAALVKGFLEYKADSRICGVIFNRTSPGMAELLTPAIESLGIKVYGCLPECRQAQLDSRHLGLVLPGEVEKLQEQLAVLAVEVERNVDVDGLLRLAKEAEALNTVGGLMEQQTRAATVKIGIAEDEAFCFYYQENRDLLLSMGAELIRFSPLRDRCLPDGICGLILGGGYPELYAKELSDNKPMLEAVRSALYHGMPYLAECGGFLYLQKELKTASGQVFSMASVIDGQAYPLGKLSRFGYIEVRPLTDTPYLKLGESIRGHEFHYWDTTENGADMTAVKPRGKKSWPCIHSDGSGLAGFPHLYYPSNPTLVRRFLERAAGYGKEKENLSAIEGLNDCIEFI